MKLYSINTGNFKLDGGAMFGVVPKVLWQKTNPADSNNLCPWSMRSLLIEDGKRLILIDNGIGDKQSEKFFSHFHLHGDDSLEKGLRQYGFHPNDVTDVFLTHLHFDHCGGGVKRTTNGSFKMVFKNATYWSNQQHWQWATKPNDREKVSFLAENLLPMEDSGQLRFVEKEGELFPNFSVKFMNGHTEAQMIPHIKYQDKTIVFSADLLPSVGHIPLPYVMGYDVRPLVTLQEKKVFLENAAKQGHILFLEHDYYSECCIVEKSERGVCLARNFSLTDI